MSWTLNGTPLADLGVRLIGGTIRGLSTSTMQFEVMANFDDAAPFAWDVPLMLAGPGGVIFRGRVRQMPAFGRGPREGQSLVIEDAWQDLEDTIYQEEWAIGAGVKEYPMAVLGLDKYGDPISTGRQIRDAIQFAAGAGVDIQLGTVDDGVILWPSEVENMSCAEVIRQQLRWHPDWVAWLDYQTNPPTFHCRAPEHATLRSVSVAGDGWVKDFSVVERKDRVPRSVRIIYRTATVIDGTVYRNTVTDLYPVGGPEKGPRVMSAIVDLAGGQMQFQKSRIQTRTLPDSEGEVLAWLKKKFPQIEDVPSGGVTIGDFSKVLVPDSEDHAPPVNPNATRLNVDDADDLPRELVRGQIEDWMRRKVGKVRVKFSLTVGGGVTEAQRKALEKIPTDIVVTATNAVTKIYKGVTQWSPPEQAPVGIAQAVYSSLEAAQFEGAVTIKGMEIPTGRWHGCALNITGGRPEWATMKAPITQVSFDVDAGELTASFGPPEFLAPQDFLELQRMLRTRPVRWWSKDERSSNELGAENAPGSQGDTVGAYDQPETVILGGGGEGEPLPFEVHSILKDESGEGAWKCKVRTGFLREVKVNSGADPAIIYHTPSGIGEEHEIEDGKSLYVKVVTDEKGNVTQCDFSIETPPKTSTPYQPPPSGTSGEYWYRIANISITGDPEKVEVSYYHLGSEVTHTPTLWEGVNVGGGEFEVFESRDSGADNYRFRTLKNLGGDGQVIIKGSGEGGAGETIDFKRIAPRVTNPQIKVVDGGDNIRIEGNGQDLFSDLAGGGVIQINDGLVNSMAPPPQLWSGTATVIHQSGGGAILGGISLTIVKGAVAQAFTIEAASGGGGIEYVPVDDGGVASVTVTSYTPA